ncbi:PorP/SprF family type IX secretion system membrane protein [Myroides sp. LJL119]
MKVQEKNINGFWWKCIVLLLSIPSLAQQQSEFSTYMYNISSYNPAYVNNANATTLLGTYRNQWVGLQGAPKTFNLSGNSLLSQTNLGIGIHFKNESIGAIHSNNFALDLSYRVAIKQSLNLAVGLKASFENQKVNYAMMDFWDSTDPFASLTKVRSQNPNIGIGLFFWWDKGYIGVAMPYLIHHRVFSDQLTSITPLHNQSYFNAGYIVDISDDIVVKPAVLFRFIKGAPIQGNLSAIFYYKTKVNIGLNFQPSASWSFLTGYQVSKPIFIGYTFDQTTSGLQSYSKGSHEIFLRYEFFNRYRTNNKTKYF